MDGLVRIIEDKQGEKKFLFKNYFVPLTNAKAITWIVFIGLIVFFNGLFTPFFFDDDLQIVSNPLIHSLANVPYFFLGGTFFDAGSGQIPVISTFG